MTHDKNHPFIETSIFFHQKITIKKSLTIHGLTTLNPWISYAFTAFPMAFPNGDPPARTRTTPPPARTRGSGRAVPPPRREAPKMGEIFEWAMSPCY